MKAATSGESAAAPDMQKRMLPPKRHEPWTDELSHNCQRSRLRHGVTLDTGLGDALGGGFLGLANEDLLQTGRSFELSVDAVVELVPHGAQPKERRV